MVIFTTRRSDIYKNDKDYDYVHLSLEKFTDMVKMQTKSYDVMDIQDFMYKFHCSIDTALEVLGYLYHIGIVKQVKGKYYMFIYDNKEAN